MPPQPCHGCRWVDNCPTAGMVNRLALENWITGGDFECPDYTPAYYHGIEGVFS